MFSSKVYAHIPKPIPQVQRIPIFRDLILCQTSTKIYWLPYIVQTMYIIIANYRAEAI